MMVVGADGVCREERVSGSIESESKGGKRLSVSHLMFILCVCVFCLLFDCHFTNFIFALLSPAC
jgi:hypothetical protein